MSWGLRVRLSPLPGPADEPGQVVWDGARISFEQLGKFSSEASGRKHSGRITLMANLVESVRRNESQRATEVLAEIEGKLELIGSERQPRFTITGGLPAPLEELDGSASSDSASDERTEERVLRFDFDTTQFEQLAPEFGSEIIVNIDAKTFRYMEVSAKLELDGQEESGPTQNEILDVFITRKNPPRIEDAVFVIRRGGVPAESAIATIETPRGTRLERTADEAGIVRVRGRSGDFYALVSVKEKEQEQAIVSFNLQNGDTALA